MLLGSELGFSKITSSSSLGVRGPRMNSMAITQTPMIASNTKNHHQSEAPA